MIAAMLLVWLILSMLSRPVAQDAQAFTITARQFTFDVSPSPFTVNQGDAVTLTVTAADNGTGEGHGFFLEQYAPNLNFVNHGETLTLQFVADVAGSFNFFCTRICGTGHGEMAGVFTVVPAEIEQPMIGGFNPVSGPREGGTVVTISGSGFQPGAAVKFGDADAASLVVAGPTEIFAESPPHEPGEVAITVRNPDGGTATSSGLFTYSAPLPPPPPPPPPALSVGAVFPDSGPPAGGTALSIDGSAFLPGATVTIGDRTAREVVVVNANFITALTPPGPFDFAASVSQDVTVTNPDGESATLARGFTWILPLPSIASVTPPRGPASGGTTVTITGAGFSTATSLTVRFGGVPATRVRVIDAVTLTAVTPAHDGGRVDVMIAGMNGAATAAGAFSFEASRRRAVRH